MRITSKDAYLIQEGNTFKVGTSKVEKTLELDEAGSFTMTGYTNILTGSSYLSGKQASDEFAISFNGKGYSGSDCAWHLVDVSTQIRSQDELEAIITLKNDVLQVARHYVLIPAWASSRNGPFTRTSPAPTRRSTAPGFSSSA